MAREVNAVLAQILSEQRGISEAKAEEIVKNMRAANQYQVRLSASVSPRVVLRGARFALSAATRFVTALFVDHGDGSSWLTSWLCRRMSGHRGGQQPPEFSIGIFGGELAYRADTVGGPPILQPLGGAFRGWAGLGWAGWLAFATPSSLAPRSTFCVKDVLATGFADTLPRIATCAITNFLA